MGNLYSNYSIIIVYVDSEYYEYNEYYIILL